MNLVSDMTNADELRAAWRRLGYRFASDKSATEADLERLIVASIRVGQEQPDLYWAGVTWLVGYGDLLSIRRFHRLVPADLGHVAGAMLDVAVESGADRRLQLVSRMWRPAQVPQILFSVMGIAHSTREHEKDNCLPVFAKWGLWCSSTSVKVDALESRRAVLKANRILACRALLGTGVRADILALLSDGTRSYIRQLATRLDYSYQPVHSEIQHLARNDMVQTERVGTASMVSLTPRGLDLTRAITA